MDKYEQYNSFIDRAYARRRSWDSFLYQISKSKAYDISLLNNMLGQAELMRREAIQYMRCANPTTNSDYILAYQVLKDASVHSWDRSCSADYMYAATGMEMKFALDTTGDGINDTYLVATPPQVSLSKEWQFSTTKIP